MLNLNGCCIECASLRDQRPKDMQVSYIHFWPWSGLWRFSTKLIPVPRFSPIVLISRFLAFFHVCRTSPFYDIWKMLKMKCWQKIKWSWEKIKPKYTMQHNQYEFFFTTEEYHRCGVRCKCRQSNKCFFILDLTERRHSRYEESDRVTHCGWFWFPDQLLIYQG